MATDTVIVGAGHAGLAVSRLLTDAGRDHVVLDRGRLAERWRTERWDSLHLLTPNWMTRLPGWCYTGPDPDGFLSSAELIQHLERYAASFQAPVIPQSVVDDDVTRALILKLVGQPGGLEPPARILREIDGLDDAQWRVVGGSGGREAEGDRRQQMDRESHAISMRHRTALGKLAERPWSRGLLQLPGHAGHRGSLMSTVRGARVVSG